MRKVCLLCKKQFQKYKNCSLKKWNDHKYCSRKCYWISLKGKTPKNTKGLLKGRGLFKNKKLKQLWGVKHPRWKGGRIKNSNGYILIQLNGNRYLEHRLIVEKFLKRKLRSDEIIHHKNRLKDDNRLENLEIINNFADHMRIHGRYD